MLDNASKPSNGITVKVDKNGLDINASNGALKIVDEWWNGTLTWIHDNQLPFMAILLFFAFALYQRRKRLENTARMKEEFTERRENSKQPRLPLPVPAEDKKR